MAFLVFEGLDGSGKTSLIRDVQSHLTHSGTKVLVTREPGGTPLGEELRQMVLRKEGDTPVPHCEILMYEAIRAQHVAKVIRPALERNEWVLCDRFTASSIAFQAHGRSLNLSDIEWLNRFATQNLEPHLNVLLDLPIEVSLARQEKRFQSTGESADRFESEARDFHQRVRQSYLEQAQKKPEKWLVLDATQSTLALAQELLGTLKRKKWLAS